MSTRTLDTTTRAVLLTFGLYLTAVALYALVAPTGFFENVGPFGTRNDHYTRDGGTFQLALGVSALYALARPRWARPILGATALQFGLHAANHLADITEADPEWIGYFDFFGLAAGAAVLAWAFVRLGRREDAR